MTIPSLPPAPALGDSPEVFNTKAFEFVAALDDWGTAANALAVDVNADAASADADAATATTQAGIATTGANTATTQAGIATTKAGEAATSANLADASADAANLSAIAAAASAASVDPDSLVYDTGDQTIAGVKTFSSNPILSGGTANGVAYLNGSKVLTTGSALVFDGTNLGLGVTPSAWGSGNRAYQVAPTGVAYTPALSYVGGEANFSHNCYHDGTSWKFAGTGFGATRLEAGIQGAFRWFSSGNVTGTAGNAISFTQAMTLDANGNLILNDTSRIGSARLSLLVNPSVENAIAVKTSSNGDIAAFRVLSSDGNEQGAINVNTSTQLMTFRTANAERARIDSSGNLLVGTTDSAGFSGTNTGIWIRGGIATIQAARNNDPTCNFGRLGTDGSIITFQKGVTDVGNISVTGSSTSYNTSSDYRLKENIEPMTGALAKVALLKPVTYKWKSDGSDGEGFIAHELAEVAPQCVHGEKDAVDEDGTPAYQGIDTSFLVATLTAAIQEQQAIITQLQADVAALKA